jgi:hypothetical protein
MVFLERMINGEMIYFTVQIEKRLVGRTAGINIDTATKILSA